MIENEVVMVIGWGMVGMGGIVGGGLGGGRVIGVDLDDEKVGVGGKVGGGYVMNWGRENVEEGMVEYWNGIGGDVVMEGVGSGGS